jgi:hypothetical protein
VLAHVRFNDRTGPNGTLKPVLFTAGGPASGKSSALAEAGEDAIIF